MMHYIGICISVVCITSCGGGENNPQPVYPEAAAEETETTENTEESETSPETENYIDGPVFRDHHPQTTALIRRDNEWLDFDTPAEAFDDCLNGDSIFIRSGEYILESSLELWEKENVVICGEGNCKLVMNNQTDNVMWIVTCKNVTVKNLHCTHTKPSEYEQCTGNVLALDMGENISIENCDINGCGAIGVYIFGTSNVTLRNNFIHDNTLWAVEDNGRGMLKAEKSSNVSFFGNRFEHNGYLNDHQEQFCEDGTD